MKRVHIYIVMLIIVTALSPTIVLSQIARVVGLEDNKEYMELLKSEGKLKHKEDSLSKQVLQIREDFKTDLDNRVTYSAQILKIEGELFDIRSELGSIAGDINVIEQEFIIERLNSGGSIDTTTQPAEADSLSNSSLLVDNVIFSKHLVESDYLTLKKAQANEESVLKYIQIYNTNYDAIRRIIDGYSVEEDVIVADSLYQKYRSLYTLNRVINDTISSLWKSTFDNKVYFYNFILDKLNKIDKIEEFGAKLRLTREKEADVLGKYDSDVISSYYLEKKMLLENEIAIAELFHLEDSQDSLSSAINLLDSMNYTHKKAYTKERIFIDYEKIELFKPAKYNRSNPIPEYEVPIRGDIYKILLGSYSAKQYISTFKGAYPLSFMKEGGKYHYYAGSLRTIDEAVDAVEFLKTKSFRNPIIIGWVDGVKLDVDMEAEMGREGFGYRVRISHNGELPEEIEEEIQDNITTKEISRGENSYTIGLFKSEVSAKRFVKRIKDLMPELNISISEINL